MIKRCLFCYKPMTSSDLDYHSLCSKKIFGTSIPPVLPFSEDQLEPLALEVIKSQTTITGVQPKISLHLSNEAGNSSTKRFTIVGLWGGYILKPPTSAYPELPEVEDLTMHLANIAKIRIVPHALIRLQSQSLAYITKRIDRIKKEKLHMEDMCQVTERLTEYKYQGSYEQIAKAIKQHSAYPGLDIVNFFELVLFSFLTGNADMHLKNFSMLQIPGTAEFQLSPGYDLLATALVNPADDEDLALMLNGKKKKIKKNDFITAFNTVGLEQQQQQQIFKKMFNAKDEWGKMINISFLSAEMKQKYLELLEKRFERIL